MKKVATFIVIAIMAFTTAAFAGEKKSVCSNPIGDIIEQTPSIKAMQSQSARKRGYTTDTLGNKVSTQTDNSGQNRLGR